jgi:hypothetical protein
MRPELKPSVSELHNPNPRNMDDKSGLSLAMAEARLSYQEGGIPVSSDHRVISPEFLKS